MKYEQDVLKVLYEAGSDGLPIRKIARHVYNVNNSLFEEASYDDVYKAVLTIISKYKKNKNTAIESTGQRGHYRLNTSSNISRQLMLDFDKDADDMDTKQESTYTDLSLSLF